MSITRTYSCNLCRETFEPKNLVGLYWKAFPKGWDEREKFIKWSEEFHRKNNGSTPTPQTAWEARAALITQQQAQKPEEMLYDCGYHQCEGCEACSATAQTPEDEAEQSKCSDGGLCGAGGYCGECKAEQQGELVGRIENRLDHYRFYPHKLGVYDGMQVYARPPAPQQLTDEQISEIWYGLTDHMPREGMFRMRTFARAIERYFCGAGEHK